MSTFPPVLIIAGGLGTRIKSICPDLPKSLVPINGEPFVAYQLNLLRRQNVQEVIFCVAHLSQPLVNFVGNGSRFGLRVRYSYDGDRLLGTGGAVYKASGLVGSTFAVMYGDSYLDVPFAPIHQAYQKAGKPALMTVYRNENRLIPSNMLVEDGLIKDYDKAKPSPNMMHCDFGLTIFNKSAFSGFPSEQFDLSDLIVKLIKGGRLAALEMTERFYEVGSPEGVRDLEDHLKSRAKGKPDR